MVTKRVALLVNHYCKQHRIRVLFAYLLFHMHSDTRLEGGKGGAKVDRFVVELRYEQLLTTIFR